MAEEIGALRAVLALESAAFDKGVASARRQLTVLDGGFQRTGGQVIQFGSRMRDIDRASRAGSGGLQNIGFQVQDFAVQVGAGTSASQALAQQLPQLLSGFGLLGIALGTAAAVFLPLVGYLFQSRDATAGLAKEALSASGSMGSLQGAVSALEGVQRQYNDQINATGGASSAAASLVIANSAREFEARKELLRIEIELARLRASEKAADAQILKGQFDSVFASESNKIQQTRDLQDKSALLDGRGSSVAAGPGLQGAGDAFTARMRATEGREQDLLAVRKLNAEVALLNIETSRSEELLNSTFGAISGGATSATAGTRTGGGGGAPAAAQAVGVVKTEVEKLSQGAMQLQSAFGTAFVSFVTGASSAKEAVAGLLSSLATMLANQAFTSLVGGLFGGVGGNIFGGPVVASANGNAFSNGRVTAFAAGGIVNSPTMFPMANGAGLMGEAGPEAIMPLTRIGGKLGVRASGGGATVVNIDARGAVEGTAAQIDARLRQAMPDILRQSVSANRAAGARGY